MPDSRMPVPRSLAVQSVLYGNAPHDVERAGIALAHSVRLAQADGLIGDWVLLLGDCSPEPVFPGGPPTTLVAAVNSVGGTVELTKFGANLGSAAGHNALAQGAQTELMLILNPDAQVAPDTISELARALQADVGIVEARQVPLEHPKTFEPGTGITSWASTACALTPRRAFDQVGGFDAATFFLYCDDVDYSWRLRLAGYSVRYVPSAPVFHDKRLTLTGDWPASAAEIYYSAEAALMMAHKYSRPDLVRSILARYRKQKTEPVLKAVAEYERRRAEGTLPTPIDPAHKVSSFVKDNYAIHRF